MKNLNKINEVSSYKKIGKKYVNFSIVLKWYNENKTRLAEIIGVPVENLASEEELVSQSTDLINQVINPQSGGNERVNNQVQGFKKFVELEENLIHDILHNLYQADAKEFDKSLESLEFTESEIIEEIECLAIEESFMKYMKTPYLKSDFINTNINNLFSFLMLTIIKNDIERVFKYLSGEIKPYIEVYGKKYNVMGTPFERVFTSFKMLPQYFSDIEDDSDYRTSTTEYIPGYKRASSIRTPEQFKVFLVDIYKAAVETDESADGDSTQFPTGTYNQPIRNFFDLDADQQDKVIKDYFRYNNDGYSLVKISDLNLKPDDEEESEDYDYFENDLRDVFFYNKDFSKSVEANPETDYVMVKDGIEFVDLDDDRLDDKITKYFSEDFYEYNFKQGEMSDELYNALLDMDMSDLLPRFFGSSKFISYLRRYFRNNDWIVNNTKLDTNTRFNNYQSISKKSITQNAIRLKKILSEFLLYVKTNFDKVKADFKTNKENNKNFNSFVKNNAVWVGDVIDNIDLIYNLNVYNRNIKNLNKTVSEIQFLKNKNTKNLIKLREYPKDDLINYFKNNPNILQALNISYQKSLQYINMIYSNNILNMINEYYYLSIKIVKLNEMFKRPNYKNQLNLFYKDFLKKNYVKYMNNSNYPDNKYDYDKKDNSIEAFKIDLEYNINKLFLNKFNENLNKGNKFFKITLNCDISRWDVEHYSYEAETEQNLLRTDLSNLVKYQISIINVLSILNPSN